MADITILGSGGFGLALAIMCDRSQGNGVVKVSGRDRCYQENRRA